MEICLVNFPDMNGRVALVTGSTAGIGQATCEALLAQGAIVFGLGLDEAFDRSTDRYFPLAVDLAKPDAADEIVRQIRLHSNSLDYLVNVAGRDTKYSIEEGDADRFDAMLALNLRAYYLLIRAAVPLLETGTGKAIVNISSINYRLGVPKRSIYSATKAGILGLTTGLARELGARSIRINSISPGWVFTSRQEAEYFSDPVEGKQNLQYLMDRQSVRHQITPADIANHILFFLSQASIATTGHNCVVDAGWLLE
jgi:NAD(P)-dependent dehydrogenase (short-subunit alcohol dehydrogenase family)